MRIVAFGLLLLTSFAINCASPGGRVVRPSAQPARQAQEADDPEPTTVRGRLPRVALPLRYRLKLDVDPPATKVWGRRCH